MKPPARRRGKPRALAALLNRPVSRRLTQARQGDSPHGGGEFALRCPATMDFECCRLEEWAGTPCACPDGMELPHTIASQGVSTKWLELIRSEYEEMPDLHLTPAQMQRFWGIDAVTCRAVLERLLAQRALKLTPAGGYTRLRIRN